MKKNKTEQKSASARRLRGQAEENLASKSIPGEGSRKKFSDFFYFAPIGYLSCNEEGLITEVNLTAGELLETTESLLVGTPFHRFIEPEDKDIFYRYWQDLHSSARRQICEIRLKKKSGNVFYAQLISILSAGDNEPDGELLITIFDISERRRAEENTKRNEARLASLLKISQHPAESIRDLLDFALDEAIALTGSKIGYIYHYDETKKEFTLNNWSKGVMNECTIIEPETVYQLEKTGIWGEAVRQAKAIIINDFHAPHPLKRGYPEGHAPLHKFMTVPIVVENHIAGVVGVANKETDYDDADVRQLTLLMAFAWKIIDRRRYEDALRESEELYRSLFENMLNGFAYCRMLFEKEVPHDFIYLSVNKTFESLTGLKNVAGKKVSEVIPGIRESDPGLFEIYGRVALTGKPERFETYVEALKMWFYISVYSPRKEHIIAIFDVITDRKRVEAALKSSEVRYRRLFESAKDGILILDAETGAVDDVNPFLVDLLGFKREQILGRKIWEMGFLKNVVASQANFAELQQREYIRFEDLPLETAEGRLIEVEFVCNVYLVNYHKVIQCNIRDITGRKKAEAALKASYVLLQERNAELDSFSYSVSHDLRGPLRAIAAFSGMLGKEYAAQLDEEGKVYLEHIGKASDRMALIIDDLLKLSRITRAEIKRTDVDLGAFARAMAEELKRSAPERDVEFVIDDIVVHGDAGLMHIVMENLISNAWKFTSKQPHARIEFSSLKNGETTIYFVRDNGHGFNMAHSRKLFTPFQRLHSDSEFPGTGIGLAIIRRIIERHSGKVWAEGEVGSGATIYFEIPARMT